NAYRPLLPGIHHLDYQSYEDLSLVTERTACVVVEPVQAEAGIISRTTRYWDILPLSVGILFVVQRVWPP
ncbi:MAG: hypothetical protein ACXWV0_07240, partial [Flavisolibacter sp.]